MWRVNLCYLNESVLLKQCSCFKTGIVRLEVG